VEIVGFSSLAEKTAETGRSQPKLVVFGHLAAPSGEAALSGF